MNDSLASAITPTEPPNLATETRRGEVDDDETPVPSAEMVLQGNH